jgi:hypothetical protein
MPRTSRRRPSAPSLRRPTSCKGYVATKDLDVANPTHSLTQCDQQYQALLDQSTPYVLYRWVGTGAALIVFFLRVFFAQGWYIGWFSLRPPRVFCSTNASPETNIRFTHTVAYALGIYLLNLFLAFLQPKFDPSNDALDNEMEDGAVGTLPTKQDEEFRPFIRRLPEFKFWHSATRAIVISFVCSWFEVFNVPVFWPVLVMYWFMLFILTSRCPPPPR